jgi:hypothetical protein
MGDRIGYPSQAQPPRSSNIFKKKIAEIVYQEIGFKTSSF